MWKFTDLFRLCIDYKNFRFSVTCITYPCWSCQQEVVAVGGKNTSLKMGLKATDKQKESLPSTAAFLGMGKQSKLSSPGLNVKMGRGRAARGQKVEPLVKEEGEMSDNDEVYEQFKEVKWMEWCEDVMMDEEKTLKHLQRSQTTTADHPKDKLLAKIRNYLQLLDRRIDQVVLEYEKEPYKQERMTVLLWNYVSTFSILSGEKLRQIYSKLKQMQHVEGRVGPSQFNGSAPGNPTTGFIPRGFDAAKFEAWKRRKRAEADVHSQVQPQHQRTLTNGTCLPESNLSSGTLDAAPLDNQQSGNGRAYRTHQSGLP